MGQQLFSRLSRRLNLKRETAIFAGAVVASWLFILAMHGLLPGMAGSMPATLSDYGAIQCAEHSLPALLHLRCMAVGGAAGAILTLSSPLTMICALLLMTLPIGITAAYAAATAGLMLIALVGAYKLLRALPTSRYVALAGAGLYLLLPITLSMQSFGGTYWGALLLPTYIFLTWTILQKLPHRSWRVVLLMALGWTILSGFALFMDGYSYFMYVTASAILLAVWAWKRWDKTHVWVAGAMFLVANGFSYAVYHHLIPVSGSWSDSIDLFRAMGLDIITLFRPSDGLWWVKALGLHFGGAPLWGDGSNSSSNYVGFFVLGLSVFGVYAFRKKLTRLGVALLIIGLVSFTLSLGPSLKINSTKPTSVDGPISHASYLMPSSDAVLTLPTTPFYKVVPGLKSMRATYRWHLLTTLALIVFAAMGVQTLIDQKRAKVAYMLLALACLELLPSPSEAIKTHLFTAREVATFNSDVLRPLSMYVHPGQRIVYYPNAIGNNDFLADYLTPALDAWTYNIGGDKAQAVAYAQMPQPIYALLTTDDNPSTLPLSGERMRTVLQDKLVDEIVVPIFDLRWDSYGWPHTTPGASSRADQVARSAQQNGLTVKRAKFFYIISLNAAR